MKHVKHLFDFIFSFIPTRLPVGVQEFERWSDTIIRLCGPMVPNNRSTKASLAVMILHLKGTEHRKPQRFFVKTLIKACASEVAHATFSKIKEQQKADFEAEQAAAKLAAEVETQNSQSQELAPQSLTGEATARVEAPGGSKTTN